MSDKVSVIIPAYNAEQWIERCIQSVLQQSYHNFEIIVIDDGSEDGTGTYLDSIKDKEFCLCVIHQANHGVSYARNIGLQSASGKYVVFVDADDIIETSYLERLVTAMEEAQIAVCGYSQIDLENRVLKQSDIKAGITDGKGIIEQMLQFRKITSALWNKIFLLDIIREHHIEFQSQFAIGEDMVFLTEYCLNVEKGVVISDRLYRYTSNPNGAMLSGKKGTFQKKWLTEWEAVKRTEHLLMQNDVHSRMIAIKKARIADKLLGLMTQSSYEDQSFCKELQGFLRSHLGMIMIENDFSVKKKISCILNAFSSQLRAKLH